MKKLIIFLSIFIYGCDTQCLVAQTDQVVYADRFCKAQLPDYKTKAVVVAGCTGFTVTQTPVPGTVLSVTNNSINVTLKATGTNGKSSQVSFKVTLIDTVTPVITIPISIEELLTKSRKLYDLADNMVGQIDDVFLKEILVVASWDSSGVRKRFISYTDTFNLDILK